MTIDPRTIAADIMCGNARSITPGEVWAHIGQAYDTAEIDATIADDVVELIAKTGIDLIWPDGTKNSELDAARVEIERLTAQMDRMRAVVEAAKEWRDSEDVQTVGVDEIGEELIAAVDALPAPTKREDAAAPTQHVLAVTEPGVWTLRHPPTCPMDCPMFALMHAAMASSGRLPGVGQYEVEFNDLRDRALIGDRVDLHMTGADR